ncbi:hypothetical protein P691DRAFT_803792 [Macrolepiota fuliginosa MF-IS2]|uniref:SLS1 N-terminal domain-containing protein n=1 Tax=Macrolepiota fuliginosa MF-IS2 TaxID=1400762 RepID=A0A9P5XJR3_9AGAR|nr:hypothetical protein P691DRAFT_803792 [Macrolepiota fuliginosa MF-IS2]
MALRRTCLERLFTSSRSLGPACSRRVSSVALVSTHPHEPGHRTDGVLQLQDSPVKPPRRPNVQEYLNYVAENSHLTLADLESFRPESHSPVGSAQYEAEYKALMEKLDRSFTVNQLRQFLHLYGVQVSSKMRKQTAAATIVEKQWGWPSLSRSQKLARAKKERSSRVFPLTPQQALLLLGKDGAEILSLSQMYNVRLQFSHKPLSMTISGSTASVEQLERHVETLKKEIVWEDFDPPRSVNLSSSSQQLSRTSGCFLENLPDGKIRIWYRESSKDSPSRAKRLLMQHVIDGVRVPLSISPIRNEYSLSPLDRIPTYALYPFFCEPTNGPPGNKGRFRLRRVGKWFGEEDSIISPTDNSVSRDYVATTRKYDNAREQLFGQLIKTDQDHRFSVSAIPGHVVLNSQGSQSVSLAPPLEGQKRFTEVVDWVREHNPGTEFIRRAPMRFWQAPESGQRWKRRLVYETIPGSMEQACVMICEYTPERPGENIPIETEAGSAEPEKTIEPILRSGPMTRLDVSMPDDARDLRLILTCDNVIPEASWPIELLRYVQSNTSSLVFDEVPSMFEHGKKKYILKEDFYVQSNTLPVTTKGSVIHVVSERRFDPQSDESYLTYEVHCADTISDDSWHAFWSKCEEIVQDTSPLPAEENHIHN